MMFRTIVLLTIGLAVSANWALLVAGSRGYENYRHQATVFAAYHLLKHQGYATQKIIVMAYDDIALDSLNPFPEEVYNNPSSCSVNTDVRRNVKIDYSGKDVSPAIFEAILTGNKAALARVGSSRYIASLPTDNIFIYFAGIGNEGMLHFPSPVYTEYITAKGLNAILEKVRQKQRFNKLLFFLEAGFSSSMFAGLKNGSRILGVSSTSKHACPLYASTKQNTDNKVRGQFLGTYLSDDFSASWLSYSLLSDKKEKTVEFLGNISARMKFGKPEVFGDLELLGIQVGCFLFSGPNLAECESILAISNTHEHQHNIISKKEASGEECNPYNMRLDTLIALSKIKPTPIVEKKITAERESRARYDSYFLTLKRKLELKGANDLSKVGEGCLKESISKVEKFCHPLSLYSLQYIPLLLKNCAKGGSAADIDPKYGCDAIV